MFLVFVSSVFATIQRIASLATVRILRSNHIAPSIRASIAVEYHTKHC